MLIPIIGIAYMPIFHHRKFPSYSTLLAGRIPPNDIGFKSNQLQIWFNNTNESWVGEGEIPHMHSQSDECFLVLEGCIEILVGGERHVINAGEFCCFPAGVFHAVISVTPPVKSLVIRSPSVEDKIYLGDEHQGNFSISGDLAE